MRSHINILVVEDDVTQGKALEEAFSRAGYSVTLCDSSIAALNTAQNNQFHVMVVDCMLPKMNGIDMMEELWALIPYHPQVLMVTGIFKDRQVIQDAMKKTRAETFFIKPLDIPEILKHVEKLVASKIEPDLPPLMKLYTRDVINSEQLIHLMNHEGTIHAFHLMKLFQRIFHAKLTGELSLITSDGDLNTIQFYDGKVFSVKTPDKESYFGSLAISKGFVSPEDVLEALEDPTQKRLGQKLIDSMSLSPHAIQIIIEEQLALRLSQTIQDDVMSIKWESLRYPRPTEFLSTTRLKSLQEDWLQSKVSVDWIHSTLMVWGSYELSGKFHKSINGPEKIEMLFGRKDFKPSEDLSELFASLIRGQAHLGGKSDPVKDFTFLATRIERFEQESKTQNYFQILGVGEKAHQREINRAYESLRSTFSPDSLPDDCPADLIEKSTRVFNLIHKAHSGISNEVERMRYLQHLQSRRAQEALEAEPIFRAGILELMNGLYKEAALKFQSLIDKKMEIRDLRAYRIWVGLKSDRTYHEIRLDQIPPEERHSAPYLMAKGVHFRAMGQFRKSIECYRTAHVLDPRSNIARHEMKSLGKDLARLGQHKDIQEEIKNAIEGMTEQGRRRQA